MRRVLRGLAILLLVLVGLAVAAVLILQRVSDGPVGPLAGGPLRSGELVTEPVTDWSFAAGQIELALVNPPGSRTTGLMVYEGQAYVPCDLGFIWRRLPSPRARFILRILYWVKHWHEDALKDGRVVVRVQGKRYERQAVRVTDPELLAALRAQLEQAAIRVFKVELLPDTPDADAIWFFRLDPR